MRLTLDFETRSAAALATVGAWNYAKHPTTEILCAGLQVDDEGPLLWAPPALFDAAQQYARENALPWLPGISEADFLGLVARAAEVHAHNAFFERVIWDFVGGRRGWPRIPEHKWRCSMSQAAAAGLPLSLAEGAQVLELKNRKDAEGHRAMQTVSKPRRLRREGVHWHEDGPRLYQVFAYCVQDVRTEAELAGRLPPLSPAELEVWRLDQTINQRGIGVDLPMCRGAVAISVTLEESLNAELAYVTNGAVTAAAQVGALLAWANANGYPADTLERKTLDAWVASHSLPPPVHRALEIRSTLSRSSVKKYQAMLDTADPGDGRVRETQCYHGAHTGRWTGRGIQPQNYAADREGWLDDRDYGLLCRLITLGNLDLLVPFAEDPEKALAYCVRGALVPAPGSEFVVCDFAAIEARGVFWLARDPVGLDLFRRGADPYCWMAERIYQVDERLVKAGYANKDPRMSRYRAVGKQAFLGLGYGMGARKFAATCKRMAGVDIPEEEAKWAVDTYRHTFHAVKAAWDAMETRALGALRSPGQEFSLNGIVSWALEGDWLACVLPSGRKMRYYRPAEGQRQAPWGAWQPCLTYQGFELIEGGRRVWTTVETYGAKLLENVVQAVCRDLMVGAMFRAERAGYPVALTVHDELVCEVVRSRGDPERLSQLMSEPPAWAAGFPIKASGWAGERYAK